MPPGIALFHTGLGGNAGLRFTGRVPYALSYVHTMSPTPCKAQAWQCAVFLDGRRLVGRRYY